MGDIVPNKKRLFIIGAGGFGRELESWIYRSSEVLTEFELIGFLDDDPYALKDFPSKLSVVGDLNCKFSSDDSVVVAIANPTIKEIIYNKLKEKVQFYTFIDSSAIVADYANIGEGSVICPFSIVSTNAKLGRLVSVNSGSQIGHDAILGDFSSLMANVDIGGEVKLAEKIFIGTNASIIPRISIVSGVTIGIGSIVFKKIKKAGTYIGNPAKKIF